MKTLLVFGLTIGTVAFLAYGLSVSAQDTATSVWDGVYTEEQAQRGDLVYAKSCAECHGEALEGMDDSPPLAGSDFLWDWNELSVGDLFERLRVSMPDGKANSVSKQEKADALAFILRTNEFPAGDTEIAPSTQALRPIAILAVKPE